MQERRTTIRIPNSCRVQYCSAEDMFPHDGRMVNLSERGAAINAREAHREGDQLTVGFSLPGEDDLLTFTGHVRWSGQQSRGRNKYPVGLEWLPAGPTARHRLLAFLHDQTPKISAKQITRGSIRDWRKNVSIKRLVARIVFTFGAIIMTYLAMQTLSLNRDIGKFAMVVQEQNAMMRHLEDQREQLQRTLLVTQGHLGVAAEEMVRLNISSKQFDQEVHRLHDELAVVELSFAKLQTDRVDLIQMVVDLEWQRMKLEQLLAKVPELRRAIRASIEGRIIGGKPIPSFLQPPTQSSVLNYSNNGNQGFLLRNGASTTTQEVPSMQIRVHEPQLEEAGT